MSGDTKPPVGVEHEPDSIDLGHENGRELVVETPLPRCLTHGSRLSTREVATEANIPPAPRLPDFARAPEAARSDQSRDSDAPPSSDKALGLPTDRVLPGSPALVSTFRPKPPVRSCYSLTRVLREERVYCPPGRLPGRKPRRR